MMQRWLLGALLLGLLPALVVSGGRELADAIGTRIGAGLGSAFSVLGAPRPAPLVLIEPLEAPDDASSLSLASTVQARPSKAGRKPRAGAHAGDPAPAPGVLVSARTVLSLANRGVSPSAVLVPPSGPRPAGLRLAGVGALGIGMRDGDVLTRVLGVPVSSVSAVADLVIRARARQLPRISGEFWRDGRPRTVVVEQPYLDPVAAPTNKKGLTLTPDEAGPKLTSL